MLYRSYGNALRITGADSCKSVLINGSKSLSTRFNPTIGCIQSWGSNQKWSFPVIIDNMMNLEMLMWASKETGDNKFRDCCYPCQYVYRKSFPQGLQFFSCGFLYSRNWSSSVKMCMHQWIQWESVRAKGRAWGLYGYGMMYRETGDKRYPDQENHIADFILNHPNLPKDKIP